MKTVFLCINIIVRLITFNDTSNKIFDNSKLVTIQNKDTTTFGYNYQILDSIIKKNPYNTSIVYKKSVKYMENYTGIKAHQDGDYFGWHFFSQQDLIAWRNFYKNHTKLLLGQYFNKRAN